jgi:hypothetical protein
MPDLEEKLMSRKHTTNRRIIIKEQPIDIRVTQSIMQIAVNIINSALMKFN